MVTTLKLRKQGGSLAVTLPKEVVQELGVRAGGSLHLVQVGPGSPAHVARSGDGRGTAGARESDA